MHTSKRSVSGCPICGIAQKDQHSNRESGICDALKNRVSGKVLDANGQFVMPRYKKNDKKAA